VELFLWFWLNQILVVAGFTMLTIFLMVLLSTLWLL
jgi:hypothetical protein